VQWSSVVVSALNLNCVNFDRRYILSAVNEADNSVVLH
jgi:hypothetical protein